MLTIRSQDADTEITLVRDSLALWHYDLMDVDEADSLLIGKILFYRNKPVDDLRYEQVYQTKRMPAIIYWVYPAHMLDSVERMAEAAKRYASCAPPSVGGDYYVLKNFILISYSACVNCASADHRIDFCRGNILQILKPVAAKEYDSFTDLCRDLPVKRNEIRDPYVLPRKIRKLTKKLTTEDMILGCRTGNAAMETPPYRAFRKLVEEAGRDDLKKLTESVDPVIRGYAFWALTIRDKRYLLKNSYRYTFDEEWVETLLHGCVPTPYRIKDFVEMLIEIPEDHMHMYYEE